MERKWLVYCHTNKINNKKYFGITCKTTKKRWGKDGYNYSTSPYFYNAIKKHGWDNFEHEILHTNLSEQEAKEYEKKYISEFNTNDRIYGYNRTAGGDGTVGLQFTLEAHKKRGTCKEVVQLSLNGEYINTYFNMHEAAREIEGSFAHISSCCNCRYKREKHKGFLWMFSTDYYKWDKTIETYYSRFEQMPVKHPKPKPMAKIRTKIKKKIKLYSDKGELIQIFDSIVDASFTLKENSNTITKCCNSKQKTPNGYNVRFENDEFDEIKYKKRISKKGIKVAQYDESGYLIKVFDKLKDVKIDGFCIDTVAKCCIGNKSLYKGFIWQYFNNDIKNIHDDKVKEILQIDKNKKQKLLISINQYTLEGIYIKTFQSFGDAKSFIGSDVGCCCRGECKSIKGFIWAYNKGDYSNLTSEQLEMYKTNYYKPINQYDLQGNFIKSFKSIKDAGEILKINSGNIVAMLKGRQKTAHGFVWEYA